MKKRVLFLLRTESFQLDNSGLNRTNYTGGNDSDAIMNQLDNGETPAEIRIVDHQSAVPIVIKAKGGTHMKSHQWVLIVYMVPFVLSVICGCTILGLRTDRSITGFEYPEVPEDYPYRVYWQRSEDERVKIAPEEVGEMELLSMAMVKLWSEGDRDFTGGVIENGTFYPLYSDVAYVEWDQYEEPDGTIHRYVGSVLTVGPNDSDKIMDQLNNGETPEGIRIVDYKSAGIDPYEFLSK